MSSSFESRLPELSHLFNNNNNNNNNNFFFNYNNTFIDSHSENTMDR